MPPPSLETQQEYQKLFDEFWDTLYPNDDFEGTEQALTNAIWDYVISHASESTRNELLARQKVIEQAWEQGDLIG